MVPLCSEVSRGKRVDSGRDHSTAQFRLRASGCGRAEELGVKRKGKGLCDSPKEVNLPGLALALRVCGSAIRRVPGC